MPKPDFNELLKVLKCEVPSRPVLFEFYMKGPPFSSALWTS